jgi:hypothetical protein
MRTFIFILLCSQFYACVGDSEKTEFSISGRLIDSTSENTDLSKYEIYAKSIFGTREEDLGYCKVSSNGYFEITYLANENVVGNNLRLAVLPFTYAQHKFEWLPLAQNWHKVFYIGDSAKVFVKLNRKLRADETFYLRTNAGNYNFSGPSTNAEIGVVRVRNKNDNFYYSLDNKNFNILYVSPTGDPIVDTLTLILNP